MSLFPARLKAGQQSLKLRIGVRIPGREPKKQLQHYNFMKPIRFVTITTDISSKVVGSTIFVGYAAYIIWNDARGNKRTHTISAGEVIENQTQNTTNVFELKAFEETLKFVVGNLFDCRGDVLVWNCDNIGAVQRLQTNATNDTQARNIFRFAYEIAPKIRPRHVKGHTNNRTNNPREWVNNVCDEMARTKMLELETQWHAKRKSSKHRKNC